MQPPKLVRQLTYDKWEYALNCFEALLRKEGDRFLVAWDSDIVGRYTYFYLEYSKGQSKQRTETTSDFTHIQNFSNFQYLPGNFGD